MKSKLYMQNRELSWLNFNERVLDEARDENVPIGERLRFLSIFVSNLDEFMMIRVGSLFDHVLLGESHVDSKTGMSVQEQIEAIYMKLKSLYEKKDMVYKEITSKLKESSIYNLKIKDLKKDEIDIVKEYFKEYIKPILSPAIVNRQFPFPHLKNNRPYVILKLLKGEKQTHGIISIPPNCPKIIFLNKDKTRFILSEEVILKYAHKLFKKFEVAEKSFIRVTRNADVNLDEELVDEDDDYISQLKFLLKKRGRLAAVRLEYSSNLDMETIKLLKKNLKLSEQFFINNKIPICFDFAEELLRNLPSKVLNDIMHVQIKPQHSHLIDLDKSMIEQIKQKDLLLSFPYQSITPFLSLLKEAAGNPKVASIKISIYRMAQKTRIVDYLCRAAENGKNVFVIMELRARFDEKNNINWSEKLIEAGCTVVYGLEKYKVHSKVCSISIVEDSGNISYISQIGTGNYNETTAKLYTDLSLLTANQDIGEDIEELFKNIPTENLSGEYHSILVSPKGIKGKIIELIEDEIKKQEKNKNGRIILKINSLTDTGVIKALVKASQAGVKIDLIIRGISCLVPSIEGHTENIKITSIVGRFLEHSRIYAFGTGDDLKMYISSADCMTRNLEKRVEVATPIYDEDIRNKLYESLEIMLKDNVKARFMNFSGAYEKKTNGEILDSQMYFVKEAYDNVVQSVKY
ncbi:polyphosphate kinase 1 [Candidatus Epulonipiscium fishelsonii]|uniref:Polyphosphate kinase 1 n=1 Tax=Candidatus Epulonipiscium fishelsonii TaxID=77094 RepID=A0ACC8X719_9FIRM|nr:polyphosphate kinase 1 [Epulopiscium sp. SCG-B11WGA-EpuloA1]ONI42669.1 polyphosphate kinase 1 [Epulopiscium sp. SCG-B05WGA-EpuloA1]ONI47816.1 polyphosphate kinase 1 [Epulopiscium sp. SCG-C06WGA-EpuloA1]